MWMLMLASTACSTQYFILSTLQSKSAKQKDMWVKFFVCFLFLFFWVSFNCNE